MSKITCAEAQTKLAEITRLKDEFLQVLDHASHSETPIEEAKHSAKTALQLKSALMTEMHEFLLELGIYPITIDYSLSLTQMIEQGKYDQSGENIVARFPIEGEGDASLDLELITCDRGLTTEEVRTELEARGFFPAKIEHLLAFGAQYPDKQREFFIAALGSSWVDPAGYRYVPYLDGSDSTRNLSLRWGKPGRQWGRLDLQTGQVFRFLAVSK